MEMTRTAKRTTYKLEADLAGLGWLEAECSADSLKRQCNKKQKKILIFTCML